MKYLCSYLSYVAGLVEQGKQDMIEIDGEELKKSVLLESRYRVGRVVDLGPRVRAGGEHFVGEYVNDTGVRVVLAAEEHHVLERVRQAVVVVGFGGEREVAFHDRARHVTRVQEHARALRHVFRHGYETFFVLFRVDSRQQAERRRRRRGQRRGRRRLHD